MLKALCVAETQLHATIKILSPYLRQRLYKMGIQTPKTVVLMTQVTILRLFQNTHKNDLSHLLSTRDIPRMRFLTLVRCYFSRDTPLIIDIHLNSELTTTIATQTAPHCVIYPIIIIKYVFSVLQGTVWCTLIHCT